MVLRRTASLVLVLAVSTCTDDRRAIDSGLSADKLGSELTADEQAALCEAGDVYLDEQFPDEVDKVHYCIAVHHYDCSKLSECVNSTEPASKRFTCALPLDWSTCDVTVAELEACWTEIFAALGAGLEQQECGESFPRVDISEACEQIELRCPRAG